MAPLGCLLGDTQMNITILGTGNMAKGLASVFAAGGYDVILGFARC